MDAGYDAMLAAIRSNNSPNLLILYYSDAMRVENLMLVPYFFLTESAIEKRKPLGPSARRAGWVGCNILLRNIPEEGRIKLVSSGRVIDYQYVLSQFQSIRPVEKLSVYARGWTLDVLRYIQMLGKEDFTLSDVYRFEHDLGLIHPSNNNIRAKIRQQLQVLRDMGFIKFRSRGQYALVKQGYNP